MNRRAPAHATTPRAVNGDGALLVLALSGLLGFWIGIACFPTWQVAVETAQVLAGLVKYPSTNPFYIYHVKLWTVLHEILAVALRLGISEITLSEVLSGVLGMVSLQALSVFVFAFSGDVAYSVGAGFVLFLSGAAEFAGTYPINLMGISNTYGTLGLSVMVLTFALLGSGCYRLGGLLLGVLPALHPSIGVWAGVIVAVCLATDFKRLTAELRPGLPWFGAGCVVTVVSLALHLVAAHRVPPVEKAVADQYLTAFVTAWDSHRRAADLNNPAVYLNNPAVRLTAGVVPLAVVWMHLLSDRLPRAAVFLLRLVVASACLAIAFIFVSLLRPEWIPSFFEILMPLRLLNVSGMTFAALLFGLIGTYKRTPWGQLAGLVLFIGLLVGDRSRLWRVLPDDVRNTFDRTPLGGVTPLLIMAVTASVFTLCACAYTWHRRRCLSDGQPPLPRQWARRTTKAIAMARVALTIAVLLHSVPLLTVTEPRALRFRDWTHDPVFSAAAAGDGLLLTAGALHLIQLRTRRPVLLDGGGLDGLVYSLEAGPEMDRILRDVYGVDLLHPSEEGMWTASIPPVINRTNWEGYSRTRWREIRRTYNVTQVLTAPDWRLDLPIAVQTQDMRLYQIPD